MRPLLKISGMILLALGGLYLIFLLFPGYFNPVLQRVSSDSLTQVLPKTISPSSAQDYIVLTCGVNCSNCSGTGDGCAQFMIEQAQLLCADGKKGAGICYYDLITLTKACRSLCPKSKSSSLPSTPSPNPTS